MKSSEQQALEQLAELMDKRVFVGLPRPMNETLAAFARLDGQRTEDDEDDRFEAILFALEREWEMSDAESLRVAQALNAYMDAFGEDSE